MANEKQAAQKMHAAHKKLGVHALEKRAGWTEN